MIHSVDLSISCREQRKSWVHCVADMNTTVSGTSCPRSMGMAKPSSGLCDVNCQSMWMLTVCVENGPQLLPPDVYSLRRLPTVFLLRVANPRPSTEHNSCFVFRLHSKRHPPSDQAQSSQPQLFRIHVLLLHSQVTPARVPGPSTGHDSKPFHV